MSKIYTGVAYRIWEKNNNMSQMSGATKDQISAIAAEDGLIAIFPHPKELMLDYDKPFATAVAKVIAKLQHSTEMKVMADVGIQPVAKLFTISKSGNAHLYLRFGIEFSDIERIAMSAILRSDPVRDMYCMVRYWSKQSEAPVALFETPEMAKQVEDWRASIELKEKEISMIDYNSPDF